MKECGFLLNNTCLVNLKIVQQAKLQHAYLEIMTFQDDPFILTVDMCIKDVIS